MTERVDRISDLLFEPDRASSRVFGAEEKGKTVGRGSGGHSGCATSFFLRCLVELRIVRATGMPESENSGIKSSPTIERKKKGRTDSGRMESGLLESRRNYYPKTLPAGRRQATFTSPGSAAPVGSKSRYTYNGKNRLTIGQFLFW